jgi:coenzyme F420-reducing hydrogenase alpha subunit
MANVGITDEGRIHKRWEYYNETIMYTSNELGIPPPKEPDFPCPLLTADDLNNPDSKTYTERFNEFNAWYVYLSEVLARHEAKALEFVAEMTDIEATLRESYRKNSQKKTRAGEAKAPGAAEMEDRILTHARHVELRQLQLQKAEIIKIVGSKVKSIERSLALLSRQVEIRRQSYDGTNRGTSIQGRSGMPVRSPQNSSFGQRQ